MSNPIVLPVASARAPRASYLTDAPNFISIHDAESRALETGQHRGMTVEFSDDGIEWVAAWVPRLLVDGQTNTTHPTHARATVIRRYAADDIVPTTVTVRWEEFVPEEGSERRVDWDKMPTVMLGKVAKMSAYRGAFHDVIGNSYERAELDHVPGVTA